jgi:hydrogenase maturation protein HypF
MTRMAVAERYACRRIRVRGQVQGVGFRPFVFRLARELDLAGWVRNDAEGVEIEAQGRVQALDELLARIGPEAPALARVVALESRDAPLASGSGARGFLIQASRACVGTSAHTAVTPDTAVCAACLAEMFDPADRRWRHAFTNCTQCGPRYTITRALPYDRAQTSMAGFAQCTWCSAEYAAPGHRRFHAQPNACPQCGPRLKLIDLDSGKAIAGDAVAETMALLARGNIVAIKGLGGFHLACDARNAAAVARLRARKQREEKPFALMLANAVSSEAYADVPPDARLALESPERPVLLLQKGAACDSAFPGAAPGLEWLGVMLPYTPLHYLLFHEAAGRPSGTAWLNDSQRLALVMTSANPGGEPIARGNDEAQARLAGIADAVLMHDRDIVTPCDDSVMRIAAGAPRFIRRARGYTPQAIKLASGGASVLALGGFLKNTVCITRGDEAFVSQHIGDLDNAPGCEALEQVVQRLMDLLQITPEVVAHDLHPDFHSTRFAADFARSRGLKSVPVQHHHAHIGAVAAEHHIEGPLLGLALDGVGMGSDGGAWGGELLRVDGANCRRIGHLRPLRLPGGDRAAREPWRMAAAALHLLGRGAEIPARFDRSDAAAVGQMLDTGLRSPETSSCGRWFDAAAGLLGVCEVSAFEGQAAMLLEGLAERHGESEAMRDGFSIGATGVLDLSPLLAHLAEETNVGRGAACFHATLARALAQWVAEKAIATGIRRVALGGGCFLNRILSSALRNLLERQQLEVWEAERVPPNDGGLSLGQAWVAMHATGDGR